MTRVTVKVFDRGAREVARARHPVLFPELAISWISAKATSEGWPASDRKC
jgi:hypothetical protein